MRDTIIITAGCLLAILLGLWLFFGGGSTASGPVTFSIIAEGQDSGSVTERTNYRIRSMDELVELWAMVYGEDASTVPAVDFSKSEVLALFDGTHSSGGYGISLSGISDEPLTRTVSIVREEPGETCITTDALTSPFLMVVVPKTDASLAREESTETRSCD